MKYIKCRWLLAMIMSCSLFSCTNLDEEVFDRVDAGIYYQDETSGVFCRPGGMAQLERWTLGMG